MDNLDKQLQAYHKKNYKSIDFSEFKDTNDYTVQRTKSIIKLLLSNNKKIDPEQLGTIIKDLIMSLESILVQKDNNKFIKEMVGALRSFILNNKPYKSLGNVIEKLAKEKSVTNEDKMQMRKLCEMTLQIFDIVNKNKNNKFILYKNAKKYLMMLDNNENLRYICGLIILVSILKMEMGIICLTKIKNNQKILTK